MPENYIRNLPLADIVPDISCEYIITVFAVAISRSYYNILPNFPHIKRSAVRYFKLCSAFLPH